MSRNNISFSIDFECNFIKHYPGGYFDQRSNDLQEIQGVC